MSVEHIFFKIKLVWFRDLGKSKVYVVPVFTILGPIDWLCRTDLNCFSLQHGTFLQKYL